MKKNKQFYRQFDLPFSGLKVGKHQFTFPINQTFFDQFEPLQFVSNGQATINVEFEKRTTMLVLTTLVAGQVQTPCFRCNESVVTLFDGTFNLIVKFGDDAFENTDEMIQISTNEHKLNLTDLFYEYIYTSLPARFVHKKKDCNPEVIKLLEDLNIEEEKPINDPRWDALKKLK